MFAVVEFTSEQGGGLSVVNSDWLTPRKKEVFWPPYKDQKKFFKAVKNSESINSDTWELYAVQRIFYETDDFEKANKKLKIAEDTSDVVSDKDSDYFPVKKRKTSKPTRYAQSSDEESEIRRLPGPPKIKQSFLLTDGSLFKTHQDTSTTGPTTVTSGSYVHESVSTPKGISAVDKAPTALSSSSFQIENKSGFQILLENIIEIKNQNKIILAKIAKLEEESRCQNTNLPEIPVTFPMKEIDNLDSLENYLKSSEDNFCSLKLFFIGLGGTNVVSSTNKILKYVIDDRLASHYNYYGRNEKMPFEKLKLCSCIIDAVKRNSNSTTTAVETAIKVWLKHAPERVKKATR